MKPRFFLHPEVDAATGKPSPMAGVLMLGIPLPDHTRSGVKPGEAVREATRADFKSPFFKSWLAAQPKGAKLPQLVHDYLAEKESVTGEETYAMAGTPKVGIDKAAAPAKPKRTRKAKAKA